MYNNRSPKWLGVDNLCKRYCTGAAGAFWRCACTSSHGALVPFSSVGHVRSPTSSDPFSPLAWTCTFSAPFVLWGKVATACERLESKSWLVIGLLRCGFALSISKHRSDIFTHKLSRFQAQRQGGPQSSTNATAEYEMSGLQNQDRITNGGRASSSDGMTRFYNQVRSRQNRYQFMFLKFFFLSKISSIQDELRRFDANVSRIGDLHSRSLNNTDEALSQQNAAALDELLVETRALSNQIKIQIQDLEKESVPPGQDPRIRKNQAR